MSCMKPKCRSKTDDLMVSCWLCFDIYHAKCVDLAPRTADNLREDKGLRWCCRKCVAFDVEIFSFFKDSRKEFDEINKDLNALMSRFLKYRDVLVNMPRSPKRKRTSASVVNSSDNHSTANSNTAVTSLNAPTVQDQMPVVPQVNFCVKAGAAPDKSPNLQTSQTESNNQIVSQNSGSSTPLNANVFKMPSVDNSAAFLKVVSPKKTIFAGRFSTDTTTNAVVNYIKQKLCLDIDISVFKFKYAEQRTKTSFKIIVPEEYFDTIVNTEFWPPKAIIHEFVYRNNPRSDVVYLPTPNNTSSNVSKN